MPVPLFDLVLRWVHILAAVIVVGGVFFMRVVLMPAARSLPDEAHDTFRQKLLARWRPVIHSCMGLLLLSGLVRIFIVIPLHKSQMAYHAALGIKVMLALIMFVIAAALVGRNPAFEGMRKASAKWLLLSLALAIVVVCLGGFLGLLPETQPPLSP